MIYSLAWSELYQVIATVFRKFDMRLYETTESRNVKIVRDLSIAMMEPRSKGIRVKIVQEHTS